MTQADAAGNTIHISSEAELRDLAASCALDTWSRDKNVVLDSDLTLADPSFLPIPTFGGSFDGQGHTIHNVSITDSLSPAGLFGVVQAGGSVRSLHVVGTVTPSGDGRSVGGIAGENNGAHRKVQLHRHGVRSGIRRRHRRSHPAPPAASSPVRPAARSSATA